MKPLAVAPQLPLGTLPSRRRSSLTAADSLVVHHVEDLGLFLRGALPSDPPPEPEIVRAVERMALDGMDPPPHVLHALRLDADAMAARLLAGCSPAQLCVLLDTLRSLATPTRPTLAPLLTPLTPTTTTLDHAIAATADVSHPVSLSASQQDYAELHTRLDAAVRAAVERQDDTNDDDDGVDDLALALHGDAATLRAGVVAELAAAYHCARAAQLLLVMPPLATALPLGCVEQLRQLAAVSPPRTARLAPSLAAALAHELQSTPVAQTALATAFQQDGSAAALHGLMLELGRAATASLSPDVLALWTALHDAATACGRQRDFGFRAADAVDTLHGSVEVAPTVDPIDLDVDLDDDESPLQKLRRKQEDARQFAMSVQRLLQSAPLATAVRQHTLDELALVGASGASLSHEALTELVHHWDGLLQTMPLAAVQRTAAQLERLAHDVADTQWRELLARTQRAAADSARAVELLSAQAVDLYTATRLLAQGVMAALERKTTASWHEAQALGDAWSRPAAALVETAYDAAARGAFKKVARATRETKSKLAAIKSRLPSLSKLEIMRDFAQVISMVFTNLYTVALKRAPETLSRLQRDVNRVQAYLRGLANFFAADFTAVLLRYSGARVEIIPDVLFAALIAAILVGCVCLLVLVAAVMMNLDTPQATPSVQTTTARLTATRSHISEPHETAETAVVTPPAKPGFAVWLRAKLTITRVTVLLTVCQSVHLPVARLCVEVLTGSSTTSSLHHRYRAKFFWPYLHTAAIVLLVVYVFGLLVLLVVLINRNAPKVATCPPEPQPTWRGALRQSWRRLTKSKHLTIVDLDGTPVPFRNSVYAAILARDPAQLSCPYRSLYAGFERRWRYYKVVQLSMKVALTMLLIWIPDQRVSALTTLGVTALSFVSTWTAPFIDDFDDTLELCAKATAVVTCFGGVVLVYFPQSDTEWTQTVAAVVTAVNVLNGLLMVAITCCGSDGVKVWLKALRGELLFSDSKRYAADKPAHKVIPDWDVAYEVRHRVWHPFWKRTLLSLGEHEAIQRLAQGKLEEERLAAVAARQAKGGRRRSEAEAVALAQRRHWVGQADECVAAVRVLVGRVLEGPDVFYEAPDRDHKSGFGRLTVAAYPFHCEFQFDDDDDDEHHGSPKTTIVEDCDVAALLFLNFRGDVARRRVVRQQLRALSAWAKPIDLPLERDEPWAENQCDASPSSTARPTATCRCRYSRGVVRVEATDACDPSRGRFQLSIKYDDGTGEVVCPETGQILHCVINRSAVVEGDAAFALLGLTRAFDETDETTFRELLARADVAQALATHLPAVQATQRGAREQKLRRQHASDAVLGRGFRFVVYNNPRLSRRELEKYLAEDETNPRLQKIAVTRRAALDLLYEKLRFVHSDPRVALWYVFWHDVYEQNAREMAEIRANKRHLDPDEPMSIAYQVLLRDKLQSWLERRGLWGERRLLGLRWRKALFHSELLDVLYETMAKQTAA